MIGPNEVFSIRQSNIDRVDGAPADAAWAPAGLAPDALVTALMQSAPHYVVKGIFDANRNTFVLRSLRDTIQMNVERCGASEIVLSLGDKSVRMTAGEAAELCLAMNAILSSELHSDN